MRPRARWVVGCAVAIATLGTVPGAHAIVVFHAEGGGFSGPTEIHPTMEGVVPPQSVDDGEFSYGGALCPAPNAPDYMCMRFAATADIVLDSRLALHALAHVARHDAAAFPQNAQAYATAQVEIVGMTGSLDTPAPSVYVYIGLAGTYATTASSPDVVTQALATVRLNGALIQCDGTSSCPPVKVPFNSGDLSLSLRVDANVGAPTTVSGYDGSAATDFFDTLEILAIQPLDEHDQPIPGEYYTIPDVNGGPLVVDSTPPPTTTTLPGATTTTTILPAHHDHDRPPGRHHDHHGSPGRQHDDHDDARARVRGRGDHRLCPLPDRRAVDGRRCRCRSARHEARGAPAEGARRDRRCGCGSCSQDQAGVAEGGETHPRLRASAAQQEGAACARRRRADPAPHSPVRHRVGRADAARGRERLTASDRRCRSALSERGVVAPRYPSMGSCGHAAGAGAPGAAVKRSSVSYLVIVGGWPVARGGASAHNTSALPRTSRIAIRPCRGSSRV